jgi:hypothetical protein
MKQWQPCKAISDTRSRLGGALGAMALAARASVRIFQLRVKITITNTFNITVYCDL